MSLSPHPAPSLAERVKDPERCQHGYLLTWKNCPMCKQDGKVMKHGTLERAIYTALLVTYAEAKNDCLTCGRPHVDLMTATQVVLASVATSLESPPPEQPKEEA